VATDWNTISSLATGAGTLVLAVATFAAVRSANRSTRLAELATQEQLRPVLFQSQLDDPMQKIMFVDGRWLRTAGGHAALEVGDDVVYLALSLRNVGAGIGVLQGWYVWPDWQSGRDPLAVDQFRRLSRDLYIPAGGIGMWQGALRDPSEEINRQLSKLCGNPETFSIDLLYTDHVGGQRTISRFSVVPAGEGGWMASVGRHWNLDRPDSRLV
jgi:hypothetical protein